MMKKKLQSAQYCRACNVTHDADGICGYHDLQYRKVMHTAQKEVKTKKERKR